MKGLEVISQNRTTPPPSSKPSYKDYQKFLNTYNENKSDQSTSPTTLSTNSSTSSVPSMISETDNAPVPVAFKEYLQNYGNKRYNTVKPNLPKKNVKTELFIQVNEGDDKESLHGRKYNTLRSRKPPGKVILARQNSLNKCDIWKNPMKPTGHQMPVTAQLATQESVPDEMIYAKSAVLNELSTKPPALNKSPSPTPKGTIENNSLSVTFTLPPPPPKLPDFTNNIPPISLTVKKVTPTPTTTSISKSNQCRPSFISEMQSKFNGASQSRLPQRLSLTGQNYNGTIATEKKSPPICNVNLPPVLKFSTHQSKSSDLEINYSCANSQNGVATPLEKKSPPPTKSNSPTLSKCSSEDIKPLNIEIEAMCKYGQNGAVAATGKKSPPPKNVSLPPPPINVSLPQPPPINVSLPQPPPINVCLPPPPPICVSLPPPPPPAPKFLSQQNGALAGTGKKLPPSINLNLPPPAPKFLTQQSKTLDVEPNITTYVPVTDNTANVDKSDPNVKKLVYNTYRGLLGAYNNKANNMVTMPKNRVVQDQGITKQLESIELQGCLDKLNGRVNPSGENE